LAFQSLPNTVGKASEERGGNAMGLSGKDKPRVILEIAGTWSKKEDDQAIWAVARKLTEKLEGQVKKLQAVDTSAAYNPLFMNDAGPDQDVMSTYKDWKKFAKLQKEVDPKGFFAKRAGGYKYNQVV
jgi:hypothetical protein